jgi:undecaprenyl diphosphate synthase
VAAGQEESAEPSQSGGPGGQAHYVAIITDGNGRWAQRRGLPVIAGHEAGADIVKARLRDAVEFGIHELTVYSFSTENRSRDENEVAALMEMFGRRIELETPELHAEGVRMRFVGRRAAPVPPALVQRMEWAEALTADNARITLFVAFNYGGRAEIVDAARNFTGTTEEEFRAHLYAPDMHDPDLVIRTSGEQRISNFLLWQIAYSEIFVTDRLWPDFRGVHLLEAIANYQGRDRRYGGLNDTNSDEKIDTLQPVSELETEIATELSPHELTRR